jgi:hypothetical protein
MAEHSQRRWMDPCFYGPAAKVRLPVHVIHKRGVC